MTNVQIGLVLTAVGVKSALDLEVGHVHVLHVKDVYHVLSKHLVLARIHQLVLRNSIAEDLLCSIGERTLRTHLIETEIALILLGSRLFEITQKADCTCFWVDRES